jgi:hypothetical protein
MAHGQDGHRASMLKQVRKGHEVTLCDEKVEGESMELLLLGARAGVLECVFVL